MTATNNFFLWYFSGLNGLGGWFIFFLLALIAVIYILYDSQRRRLPATGWKIGVILVAALILPTILFRFSGVETQTSLEPFVEIIFYLGLIGGILPPVLAVGYYVTFQGLTGCVQGHIYEAALGECPECARLRIQSVPPPMPAYAPAGASTIQPRPVQEMPPARPMKPKVQAWLASDEGHTFQLCKSETTIGRSNNNDIQLSGETTVGRSHAKIIEQNGRFRLVDLGSKNGTRVNQQIVREPVMLYPDDQVQFGDGQTFRFITSGN